MPFVGYTDFADCVSKNQDKEDPEAYCATIMRKVEKSEAVDKRPGTPEKFKSVEQAVAKSGSAKDPAAVAASVLREDEYATIKHGKQKVEPGSKQDRYLHVKDLTHSHVKTDGKKQITRHGTKKTLTEAQYELKDPRGEGAVLDDRGQPNIIDYSNQEPLLFGLGDNSSHEYPGKIVITNESRYVDREVKRAHIPNVAATGRDATGSDKTQPTLPTGAPYELEPSHNLHGLNFNDTVDWNKMEVVSIPSGLVARKVGCTKDCKEEGGPGSGRLASLAGKISAQAPLVTSQLVNLASQIPIEGVDDEDRKEMIEAIMKNEVQQLLREAQFVEEQHPRDDEGKFTSGGISKTEIKKPHPPTTDYHPEPILASMHPESAHIETADKINKLYPGMKKEFLVQQAWKADKVRDAHTKNIEKTANDLQSMFATADIQFRVKTRKNMLEKMGRKTEYKDVSDLQDVSGLRAVVDTNEQVLKVKTQIEKRYNIVTEDDYVTTPKPPFNYRSVHINIKNPDGTVSEIQIRTPGQDKWATWAHDIVYKPGTAKMKKVIQANINSVNAYAKDLSDYYEKLDHGEKATKPKCPPELEPVKGCFDF